MIPLFLDSDAGATSRAKVIVLLLLSIPFLIVLAVKSMWQAYGRKEYRKVGLWSIFPGLLTIVYAISFLKELLGYY